MKKIALAFIAVLPLALPAGAEAQQIIEEITERFIIEGSRLNQTAAEIGSSVTVITAEDIERLGFEIAIDAIASAPGVTINQNGAFGGSASVRIRGALSEQTLVLIDGVPVNDSSSPGGGYNFARLDVENIERIEILYGPQSTLWGTDAIGGVISIITKSSEDEVGGQTFGEYGSFNSFRGGASLEYATPTSDIRLAAVGTSSDGISKADEANGNPESDGYEALTLTASGGMNFGRNVHLSSDVLWTQAETEFDSFSGGAQGSVADGNEASETEEFSANASLVADLFDGRLENKLLVGYSDITRTNFANGVQSFASEGDRIIFRYQGTMNIDDHSRLAVGAEREETSANGQETSISSLFGLYEWSPTQTFTVTGGARVDDHERFGTQTTARFAAAYNPTDHVTLRASWGQGFKAPSIFQSTFFCCGAVAPNTDLDAETSEAFDAGIDWRSPDEQATAGLTVFRQDTENQINFSFAVGGYENIAEVKSEGIEFYSSYALTNWLSISANYAFIDATDGNGDQIIQVPKQSAEFTVSITPSGPISGALLVRYNGEEQNLDGTTLDSWTRVDLTGSYQLNNRIELFGHVENLFDTDYQQILGYGTPGISGSLGIRARF